MTQPEGADLEIVLERLHRVERQSRVLMAIASVALAVAAIVLLGQVLPGSGVLTGQRVVLTDSNGTLRAVLGVWEDGSSGLLVRDAEGHDRAVFGIWQQGLSGVHLFDSSGGSRVILGTQGNGDSDLVVRGADGLIFQAP